MGRLWSSPNDLVDPGQATFGILHCEKLFLLVWRVYLSKSMDEEWMFGRVECTVASAHSGRPHSEEELASLRLHARNYILDHRAGFDESWRQFFMIDLFPENATPFNLAHTMVAERGT